MVAGRVFLCGGSVGVCAVAAALRDSAGSPVAAISVAVPSSRMGSIEGIRATAREVPGAAGQLPQYCCALATAALSAATIWVSGIGG